MSAPLAKASRMPVTSRGGSHREPMTAPMTSALDAARPKRIAVSTAACPRLYAADEPRRLERSDIC